MSAFNWEKTKIKMAQVFGLFFIIVYLEYVYFSHIVSMDQITLFNNGQLRCITKILYQVLLHIKVIYAFWHMLIFIVNIYSCHFL